MSNDYSHIAHDLAEGTAREKLRIESSVSHRTRNDLPTFYRYVVLDTIFDPHIIDETKLDHWENDLGVVNIKFAKVAPRNAIIARRIITNNSTHSENTMVLYPFLPPNISLPCNPGEHVWVMFEDQTGTKNDLGYWMWRIVGPHYVEDVNHTHPLRDGDPSFSPGIRELFNGSEPVYEINNGRAGVQDGERYTKAETATIPGGDIDAYKKLMTDSDAGRLNVYERVPRYRKRPGDVVLEGTNNSLIVLGRDRTGPVADYAQDATLGNVPQQSSDDTPALEGQGQIDIVVGRGETPVTGGDQVKNDVPTNELAKGPNQLVDAEGDPDFENDRSRLLVSQRTFVDTNFNLQDLNVEFSGGSFPGTANEQVTVVDNENGDGSIVLKTDKIRLIARSDIEFVVTGFDFDDNGKMSSTQDTTKWCALVLKANGDIVLRPAEQSYVKLGGDDAQYGLVCTDTPAPAANGQVAPVASPPILTTMGGQFATGIPGQGKLASKILVK